MKSRLRALLKPRSGEHAPGRAVTAICSAKRLARYLPTSDNCVDASSGRALEFALREVGFESQVCERMSHKQPTLMLFQSPLRWR